MEIEMTKTAIIPVLAADLAPGQTLVVLDRSEPDGEGKHAFTVYWRWSDDTDEKVHIRGQVFKTELAEFLRNRNATVVTVSSLSVITERRNNERNTIDKAVS
jgi:hypothetical protein